MIPYNVHKLQELAQKMEKQLENLAKKIEVNSSLVRLLPWGRHVRNLSSRWLPS